MEKENRGYGSWSPFFQELENQIDERDSIAGPSNDHVIITIQSESKSDRKNQNDNIGNLESEVSESKVQSSKEQRIAFYFLISESLSVLLQIFVIYGDKNRGCFLVGDKNGARCLTDKNCFCLIAGSVLSLICLVLTITNRSTKETDPRLSQLRKQIKVVDLCFTLVQFLSAVVNLFDDKSANYVSLIFPPLYAVINVVFACPEVTSKIIQNIRGTALKIREWWKKIKDCLTGSNLVAEKQVDEDQGDGNGSNQGRAEESVGSEEDAESSQLYGPERPNLRRRRRRRRRHGKEEQWIQLGEQRILEFGKLEKLGEQRLLEELEKLEKRRELEELEKREKRRELEKLEKRRELEKLEKERELEKERQGESIISIIQSLEELLAKKTREELLAKKTREQELEGLLEKTQERILRKILEILGLRSHLLRRQSIFASIFAKIQEEQRIPELEQRIQELKQQNIQKSLQKSLQNVPKLQSSGRRGRRAYRTYRSYSHR